MIIWWAVACAVAFCCFSNSLNFYIKADKNNKPDTIIYFSFTQKQKIELNNYFNNKHSKQGFNGVVLVGQKDSVFYSKSYGFSDYEKHDSLTLNSTFQLASVSKQFTAVAILQLYQKGLLKLTDSIQKYYPDFPYKGITIHQLLTHRSGLPNYLYFMQHIPTTYDTILYNQDIVNEMIIKKPKAYYRPNRRYHYSNTGYALLAAIVEKVSGQTFNEYIHKNIFTPLNMDASFTYSDLLLGVKTNTTTGYLYRWRKSEDNYLDGVLGDKGVFCSANDLLKWDQGLYTNKIINRDTLELAFRPVGKPKFFKSNYGYGWRMYHWRNDSVKVLFHSGWWHGYKSLLMRIQRDSATIIVLKNRSTGASINSKKLIKILYPIKTNIVDSTNMAITD